MYPQSRPPLIKRLGRNTKILLGVVIAVFFVIGCAFMLLVASVLIQNNTDTRWQRVVNTGPSGRTLTTPMAMRALMKWGGNDGGITVVGVQESSNSAVVDVTLSNFTVKTRNFIGMETNKYNGPAKAEFVKYNDGRWHLSRVSAGGVSWNDLNILTE